MRTLFILLISVASVYAQDCQKIGYADTGLIIGKMPEFKQIQNEVQTHGTQLEAQLKAKVQEYETKLKAYQQGAASMVDAVRLDKEAELTRLQESIQEFQQSSQASFQKKQNDLMAPVYTKVSKAIDEVAAENGYSFIINLSTVTGDDILLHADNKFDVSAQVLAKMGVTEPKKP